MLFDPPQQALLIETARQSGAFLEATLHAAAMEPNHIPILRSWRHSRAWKSIRTSVHSALSRALNAKFGKREWFSDNSSRKRVRHQDHFNYLANKYLPKHHGAKWRCDEAK